MHIRVFFRRVSHNVQEEEENNAPAILSDDEENDRDEMEMSRQALIETFRSCTIAWTVEDRSDSSASCAICLDPFERGQMATRLACFHMYHTACIEAWVEKSKMYACPDCQHDTTAATTILEPVPRQTMPVSPEHR